MTETEQVAHAAVDAVQQAEEQVPDLLELWEVPTTTFTNAYVDRQHPLTYTCYTQKCIY